MLSAHRPAPVPTELRQTRVGSYTIHSEHSGTGPPVVLLHGLSGSRRWWRFTTPALAARYRVHVPELIGFGGSRGARRLPDIAGMAAVLAEWLAAHELERVRLVGHSMGGQIAVHVAASRVMPDRLVLVNPSGLPRVWSLREAARWVAGALPPRTWGAPTFVPTIAADALRTGPRRLLRATRHLLTDDVTDLLPRITCPTLVVWGELDPVLPREHSRMLAERIPHARLVMVAGAAHNPMADRPAEFNRVLLDFLDMP